MTKFKYEGPSYYKTHSGSKVIENCPDGKTISGNLSCIEEKL